MYYIIQVQVVGSLKLSGDEMFLGSFSTLEKVQDPSEAEVQETQLDTVIRCRSDHGNPDSGGDCGP